MNTPGLRKLGFICKENPEQQERKNDKDNDFHKEKEEEEKDSYDELEKEDNKDTNSEEHNMATLEALEQKVDAINQHLGINKTETVSIKSAGGSYYLQNDTGGLPREVPYNPKSWNWLNGDGVTVSMELQAKGYPQECVDEYRLALMRAKTELRKAGVPEPKSARKPLHTW